MIAEASKEVLKESNARDAKQDDGLDMKTLFVRSIPLDKTDEDLSGFFSNFAPIKHAVVVKDKDQKSRGFGFVSFAVEDDTIEALNQARKTKLDGHQLRVDIAKRRNRSKGDAGEQATNRGPFDHKNHDENDEDALLKGKPKLIIRNMPWSCRDPNKLKKIFGRFGLVVEATIPRKPDGKLRGFAFVTMKKISNCKLAIENSKDLKIDGRPVAVDFAVQKNIWEDHKNKDQEAAEEAEEEEIKSDEDLESDQQDDEEQDSGEDNDSEASLEEDVSEAEEKETKDLQKKPMNKQESFSVFVRNVPYDATEESLSEHFSKFGPVKYALPVIDKDTGLAKGTAFVAFRYQQAYDSCLKNAPAAGATSLLIGDDVLPEYVYEGRVLSISPTLKKEQANIMAEKNASKRKELLGKAPGEKDRRNLYLLNEGKVLEGSKLATLLSDKDMEVRNASYALRVEQLKKNPSLHLSLTRLAIRNLPRAMNDKALKALARKAIVEFAAEVKQGVRHPLSKEELVRSTKEKYRHMSEEEIARQKKKDRKHGVVKQAKVIMEVKGATKGRSRGYGFVEFKDHKHALMGLRWMNVHQVGKGEILAGLNEEEKKRVDMDNLKSRRLCVEFAIENANVLKRRREHERQSRSNPKVVDQEESVQSDDKKSNEDNKVREERKRKDSGLSDDTKRLIGIKRRKKHRRN
ncbi:NOP4 (YPL043W) [Zygosaccharomyces parabailii]|nr:NOP4 (YPL043W) [Zygosaccharomyces parabailii]CDH08818.1 probable Nucleolar protein 4 [Zygosaccharomyces bailii ISA1307]